MFRCWILPTKTVTLGKEAPAVLEEELVLEQEWEPVSERVLPF